MKPKWDTQKILHAMDRIDEEMQRVIPDLQRDLAWIVKEAQNTDGLPGYVKSSLSSIDLHVGWMALTVKDKVEKLREAIPK